MDNAIFYSIWTIKWNALITIKILLILDYFQIKINSIIAAVFA